MGLGFFFFCLSRPQINIMLFQIKKKRLMDRGYQHSLTEKLLSEINKTRRNWKSSLLKQNGKEEKEISPFVTQYQPLLSKL